MRKQRHLGWLQQTILILLWNREMYGLEIQQNLLSMQERVSPGQLYPALKKLVDAGALTVREEERVGANRRYYAITEAGKGVLLHNLSSLFQLIESLMVERSSFVFTRARELLDLHPGMIVMDLSIPYMDSAKIELASSVAPTGRYILMSRNAIHNKLIRDREDGTDTADSLTILKGTEEVTALPDASVDTVLVFFTLHEDGTDWIYTEMKRLLKPDGIGVIVDFLQVRNHIMMDVLAQLIPGHSQLGIDVDEIERKLEAMDLNVVQSTTEDWIIFLTIKKSNA